MNINDNFKSVGYLGATYSENLGHSQRYYYFLAVEEKPDFYFVTDDLYIFIENQEFILYFILKYLHALNSLSLFNIKLESSSMVFAVNKSDPKRWRFRVNDIGNFIYEKDRDFYKNHAFLIEVINRILKIIQNKYIYNFIVKIRDNSEYMKDMMQCSYLEILISEVEQKLGASSESIE